MNLFHKKIFFLLLTALTSAAFAETALFNHPKHGWIVGEPLTGPKVKKKDPANEVLQFDYYLSTSNRSQGRVEIPRSDLIAGVPHTTVKLQGEDRRIAPGTVVLLKNRKPYQVQSVFADGRVALTPLEINCSSRYKLGKLSCFAPQKKTNAFIAPAIDIVAVEQTCFLKTYCRGTTLSKLNDIPLCQRVAVDGEEVANHGVNCGLQKSAMINGAFSDGTLLFGITLLNVFPESTWKYRKIPEAQNEDQQISQ